jgi:hypothetical protein
VATWVETGNASRPRGPRRFLRQAGRAAKVRALLVHVMRSEWLGADGDLDWDKRQARALLGEFAGMSAEELADV